MLNKGDYNWLSVLYSVYLKTIDHLNSNCEYLVGIQQVLRLEFRKFRIWEFGTLCMKKSIRIQRVNEAIHMLLMQRSGTF